MKESLFLLTIHVQAGVRRTLVNKDYCVSLFFSGLCPDSRGHWVPSRVTTGKQKVRQVPV